ncbi:hypothetical protein ACOSP7_011030 [Xanthoceras sorbifolium]
MMALFCIFTGFIYYKFFCVPVEIFGRSAYECRDISCRDASSLAYGFGVDGNTGYSRTTGKRRKITGEK